MHANGNVATVYWEREDKKQIELLNNLTLSVAYTLEKGDLVKYTNHSKDLNPGTLGVVLKVHKKSIEIYWAALGKKKQHNIWKNPCYLERVSDSDSTN